MMYVMKDTKTFEVLTINKEPEKGDKWEDKMCIYTINNVERLYMEQLPLHTARYYIVDADVWVKDICTPDEPMRFMFKFDPYMEVSEKDIKEREEEILKSDIAMQDAELMQDALWQLENELEEERIENEDFHDYKKVYEE